MNYESRVIEAVARHNGPGVYDPDMTFDGDLGFDSLDFIETLLELEAIIDADLLEGRFAIGMTIREFAAEVARQLETGRGSRSDTLEAANG